VQQESTIVTVVPYAVTPKDPSHALLVQVMDDVLPKKRTTGNIEVYLLTFYFLIKDIYINAPCLVIPPLGEMTIVPETLLIQ